MKEIDECCLSVAIRGIDGIPAHFSNAPHDHKTVSMYRVTERQAQYERDMRTGMLGAKASVLYDHVAPYVDPDRVRSSVDGLLPLHE